MFRALCSLSFCLTGIMSTFFDLIILNLSNVKYENPPQLQVIWDKQKGKSTVGLI